MKGVTQYKIRPMTKNDLASLSPLQPAGLRNLEQVFRLFMKVPSCKPLVAEIDAHVVATGLATVNGSVGWIGMIIVHPEFRSRSVLVRSRNFPSRMASFAMASGTRS